MKIQIYQCQNVVSPIDISLSILVMAIKDAQVRGVDLIIFPELFLGGYPAPAIAEVEIKQTANNQEDLFDKVTKISRQFCVGILFGMVRIYQDKQFNAAILVSPSGKILTEYYKINLFGEYENIIFSPGETPPTIVNFLGRKVALGICYDVETESFIRDLSLRGAEIVFAIAANMQPYDDVSNIILPWLSKKYSIQLVYANYVGFDSVYTFCGRSCLTDAKGGHIFLGSPSQSGNYIVDL